MLRHPIRSLCVLVLLAIGGRASIGAEPAATARFPILEFEVVGNSRLPVETVERSVYPFLGEQRTIQDAQGAAEALQKAYQDAGYITVLVDVPEQKVEHDTVRLRVTEGQVGRVRVVGARYYSLGEIKAAVPELDPGSVPQVGRVQQELGQLNRTADRKVTPALRPGRLPGTVDIDLNVEDQLPLHGDVALDNRANPSTTPLRATASLHYDNLWQAGHSLYLAYQTAPERSRDARVLSLNYLLPLPDSDRMVALYAVRSRSNVATTGVANVAGNGDIEGARWILPVEVDSGRFQQVTLGLDVKKFGQDTTLIGGDTSTAPIKYVPGMAQYAGTFTDGHGVTTLGATAGFGLRGLFGNNDGAFDAKRFGANANYLTVRPELTRTQSLSPRWSLYGKLDGQYASGALVSNEQFFAGGAESVRGYKEAEVLADDAVHLTGEARYSLLAALHWQRLQSAWLLAFYDGAELRSKDLLPGQEGRFVIASVGLGVRLRAWNSVNLALDLARPLKSSTTTHAFDNQLLFRLDSEF